MKSRHTLKSMSVETTGQGSTRHHPNAVGRAAARRGDRTGAITKIHRQLG